MKLVRRSNIYLALIVAGSCVAGDAMLFGRGSSDPPDIVLVIIDTLRADHLSCYGYGENTSPFIDEIASKGVLFERTYSAASWTAPSAASIHTSLYPFQHGVLTGFAATKKVIRAIPTITLNSIPDEAETIAEVLGQAGYKTFAATDNLNICKQEGFHQGFGAFASYNDRTAEVINDRLRRWKDDIRSANPYFLYIHYNDPHRPYQRRYQWYENRKDKMATLKSDYDSEINYVDAKLKEMFGLFAWDKDTIVIITSDHGEEFYEHGESGHGNNLYVENIHVPLLIYSPGHFEAGRRIAEPVGTIDILPTIRDLAGLPADPNAAGISLVPVVQGAAPSPDPRYLLSHLLRKKEEWREDLLSKSVIWGNLHYIVSVPDKEELYDVELDPGEQDSRIEELHSEAQLMKEYLIDFEETCNRLQQISVQMPLDEDRVKELKSLGYFK